MASRVANRVARDDVVIVNAMRNKGIFAPAQRFGSPVTGLRAPHGEARLARSLLWAALVQTYRAARAAGRRGIAGSQSTDDRREKRVYRLAALGGVPPKSNVADRLGRADSGFFSKSKRRRFAPHPTRAHDTRIRLPDPDLRRRLGRAVPSIGRRPRGGPGTSVERGAPGRRGTWRGPGRPLGASWPLTHRRAARW